MYDSRENIHTSRKLPWTSWLELLLHRAAEAPSKEVFGTIPDLRTVRERLSWGELESRVLALAARLQQQSTVGDRALLVLDNDADYVVSFFACMAAGLCSVTLNPPSQPKHLARLAHVAQDAGARLLLTTRAVEARLGPGPRDSLELGGLDWVAVEDTDRALTEAWRPHYPKAADLAYLQYTSGSTGQPRGVGISHANLIAQAEYMAHTFGFRPTDRGLSWLPLYHDMGLILGLLQPMYVGFPVLLTSPLSFVKYPDRWLQCISDHRISYSGGPNFAYDLCTDTVDPEALGKLDLSCWTVALNAAEPIRARTLERFFEKFGPWGFSPAAMHPAYGLAEFTLDACAKPRGTLVPMRTVDAEALESGRVEPPGAGRSLRLVSSGVTYPDTDLRIVADGVEQGPDRVGELWLAGGSVASGGYWQQPEVSRECFDARLAEAEEAGPFLRTGDLGFRDSSGHVFITGRAKDVLIVSGKNHYPQDIEECVERASAVVRPHFVAAFSADDGNFERLIVVAEVRRDAVLGFEPEREGRAAMRAVSAEHEVVIEEVVWVAQGQVPKTTSGKIQRRLCRSLWREGRFVEHARVRR